MRRFSLLTRAIGAQNTNGRFASYALAVSTIRSNAGAILQLEHFQIAPADIPSLLLRPKPGTGLAFWPAYRLLTAPLGPDPIDHAPYGIVAAGSRLR